MRFIPIIVILSSALQVCTCWLDTNHAIKFIGLKSEFKSLEEAKSLLARYLKDITKHEITVDSLIDDTAIWHSDTINSLPDCPDREIRNLVKNIRKHDMSYTREFKMGMTENFSMPTSVQVDYLGPCENIGRKRSQPDLAPPTLPPIAVTAPNFETTTEEVRLPNIETTTEVVVTTTEESLTDEAASTPAADDERWFDFSPIPSSTTMVTSLEESTTMPSATEGAANAGRALMGPPSFETTTTTTSPSIVETTTLVSTTIEPTTVDSVPVESTTLGSTTTEPALAETTTLVSTTVQPTTTVESATVAQTTQTIDDGSALVVEEHPYYGKYIGLAAGFLIFVAYLVCTRAYKRHGMYELHNE